MKNVSVYLLRHGELIEKSILTGHTDLPLSIIGQQQMQTAVESLPVIGHCISSPLRRCREFAQGFCQQHQLPLVLEESLKEFNFGDWDGQRYQDLWHNEHLANNAQIGHHDLGAFWQDPWQYPVPNGELMSDFVSRVDHFWSNLLSQPLTEHTLVICHGGVIRHILARVLGLNIPGTTHLSNIDIPYGCLVKLDIFIDQQGQVWPKLKL